MTDESQKIMNTYHIHINGQVQGVGFRPFVYKLATDMKLNGTVSNTSDGVHIIINSDIETAKKFYQKATEKAPPLSIITSHTFKQINNGQYNEFSIIESDNEKKPNLLLTPDYGVCKDCLADISNNENRRYNYAFTTCTNCGPRYSIINRLPYDRENTAMDGFTMCPDCYNEYHNPLNRRYYSQTNSCHECAVELSIFGKEEISDQNEIIEIIRNGIIEGQIVAVKGIGGYLLMADATNKDTVKTLRKRKHRPAKPFALMYASLKELEKDTLISEPEKEAFTCVESPIVLLKLKQKPESNLCTELIAPGLKQIGAMHPYTPLFALILKDLGFPIIATSANMTESPIIYEDNKAEQELNSIADLIISNNRPIVLPQDDSVVRYSPKYKQKIIIRRSRSLAPNFLGDFSRITSSESILAMGAGLKSSFTFYHLNNCYISQYLGNLISYESQEVFSKTIDHYFKVFRAQPQKIITDMHPQYFSTEKGIELAKNFSVDLEAVQHHKAHFAAVLGENNLIHSGSQILGVIWDGVGLGDDEQIWGGEFFKFCDGKITRTTHFDYFPQLAFDKFALEPRLPALSLLFNCADSDFIKSKFNENEWTNYHQLLNREAKLMTSSVGRLFDAVASIIGITDKNTFEGEAAMLLENLALQCDRELNTKTDHYLPSWSETEKLPSREIIQGVVHDVKNSIESSFIAMKFHFSLALLIKNVAQLQNIRKLAFSGGVFQNALLVDLIIEYLNEDFELYFHKQLSSNDENISYGQLMYVLNEIK